MVSLLKTFDCAISYLVYRLSTEESIQYFKSTYMFINCTNVTTLNVIRFAAYSLEMHIIQTYTNLNIFQIVNVAVY